MGNADRKPRRKDGTFIEKKELLEKVGPQPAEFEWDEVTYDADFDLFKLKRGTVNTLAEVEGRFARETGGAERREKFFAAAREAGVNIEDQEAVNKYAKEYEKAHDESLTPEQLTAALEILPLRFDAQAALARESLVWWNVEGVDLDDTFWDGASPLLEAVVDAFMGVYRPTPSGSEEKTESSTEPQKESSASSKPKA